jgi:hypothetical protein
VHPEDLARVLAAQTALADRDALHHEYRILHADGSTAGWMTGCGCCATRRAGR